MSDTLHVALGGRSYPIYFEDDAEGSRADYGAKLRRTELVEAAPKSGVGLVVVTDRNVAERYPEALASFGGPTLVLEPGESTKSLAEFGRVLNFFAEHRVPRDGLVCVVGGGVIGDLGGFGAAAWLRGVDFVQVPTTLLAMVDSSVGGKTGINLAAGKNLVGAFHQPRAVFISPAWLKTLSPGEFAGGMAEVIKTALLGDPELLAILERQPVRVESANLREVIRRCCELKAKVVAGDERELASDGGRALLNLGHTFAHAIENVAGYGTYLHGEAVAIGLHGAARLSRKLGYIRDADVARVLALLAAQDLPLRLRAPLPLQALRAAIAQDKKNRGGAVRFVVLKSLGVAATENGVPLELADTIFRELGAT